MELPPCEYPEEIMFEVFVNYRNNDGSFCAALIYYTLSRLFGSDFVFYASESIPPGADFSGAILAAVRKAKILLAIIGPQWLQAAGLSGGRYLDDPNDWVRREIAEAFRFDLIVIPVLVDDVKRPAEDDLPIEIRDLARKQYVTFHHRNVERDVRRLVDVLARLGFPPKF
jgi:hypothetical protein